MLDDRSSRCHAYAVRKQLHARPPPNPSGIPPQSEGQAAKWLSNDTRHMLTESTPKPDQITVTVNTVRINTLDQSGFEPLVPPGNGLPFHTDIISAQHFWTGGLETAGPGRYDAVAIARRRISECWL
jgi:hypothetical protein